MKDVEYEIVDVVMIRCRRPPKQIVLRLSFEHRPLVRTTENVLYFHMANGLTFGDLKNVSLPG